MRAKKRIRKKEFFQVLTLLGELDADNSGCLSLLELRAAADRTPELAKKCASLSEKRWRTIISEARRTGCERSIKIKLKIKKLF